MCAIRWVHGVFQYSQKGYTSTSRVLTRKRRKTRRRKVRMHSRNRSPNAQAGSCQRRKRVHHIKGIPKELLFVSPHPPLDTAVYAARLPRLRVEFFFGEHCVFLHVVADEEHWWEGVGELEDAGGADERG